MQNKVIVQLFAFALLVTGVVLPMTAGANNFERDFDRVFSSEAREPRMHQVRDPLEAQLFSIAEGSKGRIGVAALDLAGSAPVEVLGNQLFPMASTVKVAIIATFLEGVDQGRYRLTDRYPLLYSIPSRKFAGRSAPVRQGALLTARALIEASITRSDNHATDALLAAIGGAKSVNYWLARTGNSGIHIDRDIATLVRDDGAVNPATSIDVRDSTTPIAMVRLLAGLHNGQWLSPDSREVLLGAMSRCRTGVHRIPALLPQGAVLGHKTGTLFNTSSDVGIIRTADGRTVALAIYVTGQGSHAARDLRIAALARAVWQGSSVQFAKGLATTAH